MIDSNVKNIFFIWESGAMSFLRVMTLISFRKHHQDWKINLIINNKVKKYDSWLTTETQDFENSSIEDNFNLCKDLNINFIELEEEYSKVLEGLEDISPVHKKDLLNWYLLSINTGVVADMDIIFIDSLEEEYEKFINSPAEFGITCFNNHPKPNYLPISIMFGRNSTLCETILEKGKRDYNKDVYECCGADLFEEDLYERIIDPFDWRYFRINEELIYPFTTTIPIFEQAMMAPFIKHEPPYQFSNKTSGIHWYGGCPISQHANKILNKDNFKNINSCITNYIKKIYA